VKAFIPSRIKKEVLQELIKKSQIITIGGNGNYQNMVDHNKSLNEDEIKKNNPENQNDDRNLLSHYKG